MKTTAKIGIIFFVLLFMSITDIPIPETLFLQDSLVSEVQAIYGVRRRTRRRTAVVAYSAGAATAASANAAAASSQQQAAQAEQETAAAKQEAAAAKQEATAAKQQATQASTGLPVGAMVDVLPQGCTPFTLNNIEYQQCPENYYRSAFQGNKLVYVVTDKP